MTVRGHALNELAIGIKNINEAVALPRYVIVLVLVLFGIGDIELAVQILDVEGGKPGGDFRVKEGKRENNRSKFPVEYVDPASMEIGSVEKIASGTAADGQPFVDRAGGGVIHDEDSSGEGCYEEVPGRDRAVFGGKNEEAGMVGHDEVR